MLGSLMVSLLKENYKLLNFELRLLMRSLNEAQKFSSSNSVSQAARAIIKKAREMSDAAPLLRA